MWQDSVTSQVFTKDSIACTTHWSARPGTAQQIEPLLTPDYHV